MLKLRFEEVSEVVMVVRVAVAVVMIKMSVPKLKGRYSRYLKFLVNCNILVVVEELVIVLSNVLCSK